METLILSFTKYNDEIVMIAASLLMTTLVVLFFYWDYNRRKFKKLTHQIPASVVKNYLDSIIQNSNSLKSTLFRGSGLDIGESIPSVVPVQNLPSSNALNSGIPEEVLNQKSAEITALRRDLADKEKMVSDLEKQLTAAASGDDSSLLDEIKSLKTENQQLKDRITELEGLLAKAKESSGDDGAVSELVAELDELKEKLTEYEIIEEDLANLKRLQQENDQLKKTIADMGGESDSGPKESPDSGDDMPDSMMDSSEDGAPIPTGDEVESGDDLPIGGFEEEEEEEPVAAEPAEKADGGADMPDGSEDEGDQKSAEELLSEFEKMLG